ncbi:hypothetical protein BJV74DRAFT_950690 [Russula compacta]|nr:hypothetical protein BJV74DRAFT_950690 [Russula compacta]
MRGMRKALWPSGALALIHSFVCGVENEPVRSLEGVEVMLNPDAEPCYQFPVMGQEVPQLQQRHPNDRLTHIFRLNATQPDPATWVVLTTPPTTVVDQRSLGPLSDSDFTPELELEPGRSRRGFGGEVAALLLDIASDVDADVETGSVQGGDGDGSGSGRGSDFGDLEQATRELSLANDDEMARLPLRGVAYRTRAAEWNPHHRARSGSSPSRSPARRKPRRLVGRVTANKSGNCGAGRKESFYGFLFK